MNRLYIEPNKCIGNIYLKMIKEEVHKIYNKEKPFINGNSESYDSPPLRIEYNSNDEVIFIELSNPMGNLDIMLNDINIFNTKACDLIKQLKEYDECIENSLGYSYRFKKMNLTLWRPVAFDEKNMDDDWFKEMSKERQQEELKRLYFETIAITVSGYY